MISKFKYLHHVRSLDCYVCRDSETEPHHVLPGGVGMKGTDFGVVPLCRRHHDDYHNMGKETFQKRYKVNIYEGIIRTLEPYLEEQSKQRYVVTNDGHETTVTPGDSFEMVWDIALDMADCGHVQLTSQGEVVGIIDPEQGWSTRHEIKIELLED